MGILILLVACILSAICYRAGGMSKEASAKPSWIPVWLRESWVRDALCPLIFLSFVLLKFGVSSNWWCYLIFFGASWGALTTYWDFTGKDNFYLHGLGCSLATIPLFWTGVPWYLLLLHGVVCTVGMGWWCEKNDNDVAEEFGRGVFYIL